MVTRMVVALVVPVEVGVTIETPDLLLEDLVHLDGVRSSVESVIVEAALAAARVRIPAGSWLGLVDPVDSSSNSMTLMELRLLGL